MRTHQGIVVIILLTNIAGCARHPSNDANLIAADLKTNNEELVQALDLALMVSDKAVDDPLNANVTPTDTETDKSDQIPPVLTDAEIEACLFVLEWQLSLARFDDVRFVAIGHDGNTWLDPTDAAMKRLTTNGLKLLPASKARMPNGGETDNDRPLRGVEDPATGKSSFIFRVTVKKWIDENTAEILYDHYGGPLAGFGGTIVVELIDGKWSIKERGKAFWVS
jgi:hypothetical protein